MIWFYVFVLLSLSATVYNQGTLNNFGPYSLHWHTFETCKGPKKAECGKVSLENIPNMSDVIFILDFPRDCPATKARVTISNKESNAKKKLWNYGINDPCQHFVLGPILLEAFNLTSNCKINKGFYKIHVNMLEKASTFLGTKFFYGNYSFKITAFNKAINFFCVEANLAVEKRKL